MRTRLSRAAFALCSAVSLAAWLAVAGVWAGGYSGHWPERGTPADTTPQP